MDILPTSSFRFLSVSRLVFTAALAGLLAGCGSVGVGIGIPIFPGVSVGVGVGSSTVLHDPQQPAAAPAAAPPPVPGAQGAPLQWRDAQGRPVPECRVMGGC